MPLTHEEELVKQFLILVFRPTLQEYLQEHNPQEFTRWHGNCCRQTAIIGVRVLERVLPEYKWEAWEGQFTDIIFGKRVSYDHAWIYGKSPDHELFIDISQDYREKLFLKDRGNLYHHDIREFSQYQSMSELQRDQMDMELYLKSREYYTLKPSRVVLKEVMTALERGFHVLEHLIQQHRG